MSKILELLLKTIGLPLIKELGAYVRSLIKKLYKSIQNKTARKKKEKEINKKVNDYANSDDPNSFDDLP